MKKVDLFLVEDNPHDAKIIFRILKKEGLTDSIHWVNDGEKAINSLLYQQAWLPKVILLDIKLPKINGLEVLNRIRKNEQMKKVPVLMLTSSQQEVDIDKAYKYEANGYLVKPNSYLELKEMMKTVAKFWLNYNLTAH